MYFKEIVVVFVGGGLGSLMRFGFGRWVGFLYDRPFPLATFLVNIVACFVLGFIIGLADFKQWLSPIAKLFWIVGFCGGFSTFSAFSNDVFNLFRQGYYVHSLLYILLSILVCVTATFGGLILAEKI